MMKVNVKNETMVRIMELIAPLSGTGDAMIKVDFGVGVTKNENIPAVMNNKISLTNGVEQVEVGFFTTIPQEIEKPLEECSLLSPLESSVFKAGDFVSVCNVLTSYGSDISIETDSAKATVAIDGVAEFPLYKADGTSMKALIPHRNNSQCYENHDTEVMTLRFAASDLSSMIKSEMPLTKKINMEALRYYRITVKDIPVETVTVEKDGVSKTLPKYNAAVTMCLTNSYSFAKVGCKVFAHKGTGNDLKKRVSAAKDVEDPVISFAKEGDDVVPQIIPFKEYEKKYKEDRKIDNFQFGVPCDVMDTIVKLAGTDPDDYVDIAIGVKYIQVFMRKIGFIYTAPQKPLIGAPDFSTACGNLFELSGREGSYIEFDSKDLVNTMKLMSLYDKDDLVKRMPLIIELTGGDITVMRGEAKAVIKGIKNECKIENKVYGLDPSYIGCILAAVPAGTMRVTYGIEKPAMNFTKGDMKPSAECDGILVCGLEDVNKTISEIKASYEKEQEAKAKKEAEKGKDK